MRFAMLALAAALPTTAAFGAELLAPGDFIIAVDHSLNPSSSYPAGEAPAFAIDGDTGTKYLNFGGTGSGFIVTPFSASIIQSMQLFTANDAPDRDPLTYELYGTNDAISSTDNSLGNVENWSLISAGGLAPPVDRFTAYPTVDFANASSYSSYRLFFPTLSGATETLMQVSEVQFYTGAGATGTAVLDPGNSILAIDTITTLTPPAESAANAIDGDASTKFLSFGQDGSGVIVTPSGGPSVAVAMQLTTANDFFERDPISFEIYGTNDAILSSENSEGTSENWTLITADDITLPLDRMTESALITWANTTEYTSYKIIFTELVDQSGTFPADSFQIAEIQLFDAVPEPGSLALVGLGGLALLRRRR